MYKIFYIAALSDELRELAGSSAARPVRAHAGTLTYQRL
jgi:hypothetical protein